MGMCICRCLIRRLGGVWENPTEMYSEEEKTISTEARQLIDQSFEGLDPSKILDVHVHLLGIHPNETGCYVHSNMDNCCRCHSFNKKRIMMQASGISTDKEKDYKYVDRLVSLFENFIPPNKQSQTYQSDRIYPKALLLGLTEVFDELGRARKDLTSVHTPNSYLETIVRTHSGIFAMGPSIHPYRKDCVDLLNKYHSKGARIIKWLPNSMGIDPDNPLCDRFYEAMVELDLILLTHTGAEHSLDDADYTFNEFGNPLRIRRALEKGVKVIMAHCASEGEDDDEDSDTPTKHPSVDYFIRMMREKKYEGQLFGDISAITGFLRVAALEKIIQCDDFHHRLIYGSDFPVPCSNIVVWYGRLVSYGLITDEQADLLREIFVYNPLLADFVTKRVMRYSDSLGAVHKFPDIVFQRADLVDPNRASVVAVGGDDDDVIPLRVADAIEEIGTEDIEEKAELVSSNVQQSVRPAASGSNDDSRTGLLSASS